MDILKASDWENLVGSKEDAILIGNSPKIKDYELGEKIDKFPFVVRINDAPTNSYERLVGQKTNLRVLNRPMQEEKQVGNARSKDEILKEFNSGILLYPTEEKIEEEAEEKLKNADKVYRTHNDFRIYKQGIENSLKIDRLSTGLFSTLLLVHIFERVTLLNFDFYTSSKSYHYWEEFDGGDPSRHDFDKERLWIEAFDEKGLINYISL
jgi:Glycosyltransferase family 29 (sialyltransferase).